MYICICNGITDKQIKAEVSAGATSLADLQASLGVATCCGCCADAASAYLPGAQLDDAATIPAFSACACAAAAAIA
ncbi:MAG: (2Fe-2S)-binding protein [Neisseriaceae bacterium]|nr:(2Fe-2S)-binding protein [Neisseriaceae bacterium]MBP6862546.1 (2Fe-2S)-binding protein [Neisseriaceae bacterium]